MDTATIRRRTLAQWMKYRERPPTVGRLLRDLGPRLSVRVLMLVAAVIVMAWLGDPLWTGIAIGLFVAAVIGNLQRLHVAVRVWSVTSTFLDWAKIEQAARDERLP